MANNDDKPIGMASMGFIRVTSIAFCVTSPQRCCCWQRWGCKCAVSTYSSTAHCPWVHIGSTQPSSLYRTCCKPTHSCVGCRSSTLIWYNGVPGWSLIPRPDRCSSGAQSDFEELNDAVLCSNTANTVKLVKTLHDDSHSTAICSAMVDHCHPLLVGCPSAVVHMPCLRQGMQRAPGCTNSAAASALLGVKWTMRASRTSEWCTA